MQNVLSRRIPQPLACVALCVLLLATVTVPAHAQGSVSFRTGPCVTPDSTPAVNLTDVVDAPEVRASLKPATGFPAYPSEIRRPGYEGQVVVAFIVDKHGKVDPRSVMVMSSTDPLLSRWACQATPGIAFYPAKDHGHPVASQTMLPFVYHGPPATDSAPQGHSPEK